MHISKGHRIAWFAHDAASNALAQLQSLPDPPDVSKALAIAKLCDTIDRLQERIRIHRKGWPKRKRRSKTSKPLQSFASDSATLAKPYQEPEPTPTPATILNPANLPGLPSDAS